MNTFTSLDEINSHSDYAPLGFEKEFQTRIMNDVLNIITNLDTTKTIKSNKIPSVHFKKVKSIISPANFDLDEMVGVPEYRAGTHLEFFAEWDDYAVYWKRNGKGYQRKNLKEYALDNFSWLYFNP